MAQDVTYNRLKSTTTNSAAMSMSVEAAEKGGTEAALAAGSSAGIQATIICDADEGAGTDLQDLWKIVLTPEIDANTGDQQLRVVVTPVGGDGVDDTAVTTVVPHPEDMDAWQTAAGNSRLP